MFDSIVKRKPDLSHLYKHEFLSTLPALEFLTQATKHQLTPTPMMRGDAVKIDITDDLKRFIITPIQLYDGKIGPGQPSTNCRVSWFKRLPECRFDKKGNYYVVGATDLSALVVAHQWPQERIVWQTEAEKYWQFLIVRFFAQTKNSLITAEYKLEKKVPELPSDYIHHPDKTRHLSDYQKVALVMSLNQEIFALFMEQGTGKTPICIQRVCIEALRLRAKLKRMLYTLIVCPQQVRINWQEEFERFATCPGKVSVLRGGLFKRNEAIIDIIRPDVESFFGAAVCSYQSVENTWDKIGIVPWDLVIFDESHRMKNPQSLQSKSCRKLRDGTAKRMILTGTPIANSIMDLWAQFEALGEGISGFIDYKNFKKFFGEYKQVDGGQTGVEKLVGLKNVPLVQERLARISFAITKKEAGLNLPDKVYNTVEVVMTPKQLDWYRKVQKDLVLEVENLEARDEANGTKTVTADHILTMMLRLTQITSGHIKFDPMFDNNGNVIDYKRVEQIDEVNPKVDALMDLIEETNKDEKIIVWAVFREDIRLLGEVFKKHNLGYVSYFGDVKEKDREAARDKFNNDPNVRIFLANPQSASEGLNLLGFNHNDPEEKWLDTFTGQMVFFSQNWSAILRSQCEDRAHRRKMRAGLRITDLTVLNTVDEDIRAVVRRKREMASIVGDIKGFLSKVLGSTIESDS